MVWMDVQGHEGRVLRGANLLLKSDVPILMEYSPDLLRSCGDLELLEELIAENFSRIVNFGCPERAPLDPPAEISAREVAKLRDVDDYVDLWLSH